MNNFIYNFNNLVSNSNNNNYNFSNIPESQTITEVIEEILKTDSSTSTIQDILEFVVSTLKVSDSSNYVTPQVIVEAISELLKIDGSIDIKVIILQSVQELLKVLSSLEVTNAGVYLQVITELLNIKDKNSLQLEITEIVHDLLSILMQSFIFDANQIYVICSELLKFKDTVDVLLNVSQIINVMINELFAVYSTAYSFSEFTQHIVDQLFVNSSTILSTNFAIALSDTFKFTNSITPNISMSVYLEEIFKMNFILNLDGQLYECYCINLENQALTRYDNFEFESFCQYQRQYYGIKKDGIYLLEGKTDGGEDIRSKVKTGYFNIANIQTKGQGFSSLRLANNRLESGYAVVKNDGQIIFRIYNDKGQSFDYSLNEVYDNEKFRFQIGQGLKGSAFQLELETTGNFELKDCAIIPVVLQRKV